MAALTGQLLALGLAAVTTVLVLVGGVIFFTAGRARGMLAGVGFVVLAIGLIVSTALTWTAQMISSSMGLSSSATSVAVTIVGVVINLVGWGLVIAAMLRLRAERTGPDAASAYPGPAPYGHGRPPPGQPPYGQAPPDQPQYGQPQYGQTPHGAPYGGAPSAPPGPGWGHPASGPEGPPPPPGV